MSYDIHEPHYITYDWHWYEFCGNPLEISPIQRKYVKSCDFNPEKICIT
jgi:hypothetical protein